MDFNPTAKAITHNRLDIVIGALITLAGIAILLMHKPTTLSRADKQILEAGKR